MKHLICIETERKTQLKLTDEPWTNDEIINTAANRLLRREPQHKYDFVAIRSGKLRAEICHALTDLTEHTGKYVTFRIIDS